MATPYTDALIQLDGNGNALNSPLPFLVSKRITFAGGTTNAIGDVDGTQGTFDIFDVTGDVMVWVFGICKTSLVGAGTLEVGVADNTAAILAQIADATTLDENEVYLDATVALAEAADFKAHIIGGGLNIQGIAGSTNITAGVIDFYCFYRPLSTGAVVKAA